MHTASHASHQRDSSQNTKNILILTHLCLYRVSLTLSSHHYFMTSTINRQTSLCWGIIHQKWDQESTTLISDCLCLLWMELCSIGDTAAFLLSDQSKYSCECGVARMVVVTLKHWLTISLWFIHCGGMTQIIRDAVDDQFISFSGKHIYSAAWCDII